MFLPGGTRSSGVVYWSGLSKPDRGLWSLSRSAGFFFNIPNDSAIIRSHSIFNVIELAVFQSETNWPELRSWRGIGRFYFPISQNFEVSVVFLLLLYFLLEFWELSFTQSEKSEDWNQVLFFFFFCEASVISTGLLLKSQHRHEKSWRLLCLLNSSFFKAWKTWSN